MNILKKITNYKKKKIILDKKKANFFIIPKKNLFLNLKYKIILRKIKFQL